jgi:type I restriction enzyme M protein
MLDSVTKKRIDDLRNILVGKIPSPQSQVEQITTGLIYKFMYDMDVEAVEMGGVPSFFVADYEKYSWKNLFDPKLGGADKVQLYSDAIENMYTNPSAPQLFREIFKNSFLPFKDPSTLNMFLKEINEFHYSHSEKLGDAFEYLLSFMGSQGDAGQFRTPRHIIDFIVEIVNPQKNETILDPACGTAGFLISSYKHILSQNTDKKLGDRLNASDRKQVGDNLVGYDISPDMTRISLVNMYLHQFASPQIHEYDTLSSEDRWNEYYDVILANPPFFSPTGGIQPHTRFGVQSTRAEVLFVDYIIEHLKPTGRAGIVVPEGIIFQDGSAYAKLRKKLIDEGLVGVISLPQGVFNPYSPVKTSILILDKELNRSVDKVFFAHIDNDGYSLGSQRREIDKNDLPNLVESISNWMVNGTEQSDLKLVQKEKILRDSKCKLTISTYLERTVSNSDFSSLKVGQTLEQSKVSVHPNELETKIVNYIGLENISKNTGALEGDISSNISDISSNKYKFDEGDILYGRLRPNLNKVWLSSISGICSTDIFVLKCNSEILNKSFAKYLFLSAQFNEKVCEGISGAQLPRVKFSHFSDIEIPLPPIEVQQQIVDELEGYQKIIDGCRQVVENYKPTIDIDPSWEMVELGEVVSINPRKSEVQSLDQLTPVSFVPMEDLNENEISFVPTKSKQLQEVYGGYTYFRDDDVLLAKVTPCFENGKAGIARGLVSGIGFGSSEFYVLRSSEKVLPEWIYINTVTNQFRSQGIENFTGTSGLRRVPKSFVESYRIPVPDIDTQSQMIKKITGEIAIIDGNTRLIEIYTQKIQDRINKVWGE